MALTMNFINSGNINTFIDRVGEGRAWFGMASLMRYISVGGVSCYRMVFLISIHIHKF